VNTEPARIGGYVTLFITTAIALFVAFGGFVTQDQKEAILGFAGALVVIIPVLVEFIRSRVYAPATVDRLVSNAAITGNVPRDMSPPRG
jgi:hypothetical protein